MMDDGRMRAPRGGTATRVRSYGTQTPMQILILRPPIIAHACARSEFAYDSEF